MQKVTEKIYNQINNEIYNLEGDKWWRPDFSLNLIKTLYNPFRVGYSVEVFERFKIFPGKTSVLEVGCGGGILSEEMARKGFITTGIDPSELSLKSAASHARESNLIINYKKGTGENLPFEDNSFNVVLCCDVLEHVQDLPRVISEISRVLKIGGIFIYDTFNRTYFSKISAIKNLQEWKRWSIMPPKLHVWQMFIKPDEIKPNISYLKMLCYLRKRAAVKLTYEEFGKKFLMVKSRSTQIMYMGYAVKQN